jgi:hypothetical protein
MGKLSASLRSPEAAYNGSKPSHQAPRFRAMIFVSVGPAIRLLLPAPSMTCSTRAHRPLAFLSSAFPLVFSATTVFAQSEHQHHSTPGPDSVWQWSWDANVFAGWNYQYRKFRDFQEIESQNWFMGGLQRRLPTGTFEVNTMISLEPFTIQPLGSPQVFQTGETYQQAPLVDYQHPHDLIMGLGATYTRQIGNGSSLIGRAALVGSPALGPTPFMHRPSASENPSVPLSHHQLDATHISSGVLSVGARRQSFALEGSWFHGGESDERRTDLDVGSLDSWSLRMRWQRSGWEAQASGGRLTSPERINPFNDVTRLTASLGYTSTDGRLAAFAAWGHNREVHGNLDAYLLEATYRPRLRNAWFTRLELVTKDILGPGRHTPGETHLHPHSRVGAGTLGYVFDVLQSARGTLGVGGDVTAYLVDENLRDNYGAPLSLHVFLRYRPTRSNHTLH